MTAACAIALAAFAGLVVFIIASRFSYRYEIEWTTGAVLDHVERIREGKPLYVEPSIEWTPFLYPPGYYWVCAWVSRVLPEAQACRLVSILSSAGTAACVFSIARRLNTSRMFAAIGALSWIGCFGYTLQWYDIERCDALFVFLLALSAAIALARPKLAALAGAVLGLAFFVKQPASTFLVLVPIALAIARGPAIAFVIGEIAVVAPLFVWLHASTHGYFTFYVLKMPGAHGMEAKYITTFFVSDLSKALVLTIATALALVHAARNVRNPAQRALVSFAAYLLSALVASASSRLHLGGWPNVLMFWTTFACPALAWMLSRAHERLERDAAFAAVLGAVALQAGAFAPDPNESIPKERDARFANAFEQRMLELEKDGEVVVLGRGHVTRHRHAHNNTLLDVMRAGRDLPRDFREGIEQRRYRAIVIDDITQLDLRDMLGRDSGLAVLFGKHYFIAERIDDRTPQPVVGYPTLPRWVMRPRRRPLESLTRDEAFTRMRIEMGFAERNMRITQSTGVHEEGLDIEEEASRALSEHARK
jgi:hypothetical protein